MSVREVDADGDPADYDVAGRDEVGEVATVYATYAHDPKTAPDSPRAVLDQLQPHQDQHR